MLIHAEIDNKIIDNKQLFSGLEINVEANDKIAIIGRNGVGKTTLFNMLTGKDTDYEGTISLGRGAHVTATRQEHHDLGDKSVMDYIMDDLPDYRRLENIIEIYPGTMGDNLKKIDIYSEALERFSQLDYYDITNKIIRSLASYQLENTSNQKMASLSGGQRRFVELVIVEHSNAQLALIDEPTNHMDYAAKEAFLSWFKTAKCAIVVISHDRDVLENVSRIIEIKDYAATNYPGNYSSYLAQNASQTANAVNEFETTERRIANIRKQINYARSKKSSWTGTADKKNPFVVMETRLKKELAELEELERPSFWIDQESASSLKPKVEASYQKHKAKTIRITRISQNERSRTLLKLDKVQVGYDESLFRPLNLQLATGDRMQLVGRNGAGKTTLVKAILASSLGASASTSTLLAGQIICDSKLRINTYEQEMSDNLLDSSLAEVIESLYGVYDISLTSEQIMRILSNFLFDPQADRNQPVRNLSGGQKARLQLIKMFANEPNLLILDEPTNHLDLPSIEELENALASYRGALLYVSHDSYFASKLGGESVELTARLA